MALNRFPSYEELRKSSQGAEDDILNIIETPVREWDIFEISWYPWTWKTLISWMKFAQYNGQKIYLTYAHMLVAYTRQWLWVRGGIYVLDKRLQNHYDTSDFDDEMGIEQKRPIWIKNLEDDSQWTILFIDEVQDLSPYEVAQLTLKFNKVVVCWDRDQAIYKKSNAWIDFFSEYEKSLKKLEPNLERKRRIRWPYELKRNYRNTKPVFDFARCFHPDSRRLNDVEIMKQWWEKPELWSWSTDIMYDKIINYCVNEINSQSVVWIIVSTKTDIEDIKNKIDEGLKKRLWEKYNDKLVKSYISMWSSKNKEYQSEQCMNASVIITTIFSMKWLEADDIIMRNYWKNSWWWNDSTSKNRYYVWFTRSRNNLIICQYETNFWPYDVPSDLYTLKDFNPKNNVVKIEEDEYDDLPF